MVGLGEGAQEWPCFADDEDAKGGQGSCLLLRKLVRGRGGASETERETEKVSLADL